MAFLERGGGALAGGIGVVAAEDGFGRKGREPGEDAGGDAGRGGDLGGGGAMEGEQTGREGVDGALGEQQAGRPAGTGRSRPEAAAPLAGTLGEALCLPPRQHQGETR